MESIDGKYALSKNIKEKIESLSNSDCSVHVIDGLKHSTKQIYDHLYKNNILIQCQSKALRKLLIHGFDSEQIFQQIDLQNKSAFEHFTKCIASVDKKFSSNTNHDCPESSEDDKIETSTFTRSDLSHDKEYIFDDDSDCSGDDLSAPFPQGIDNSLDSLNLSNSEDNDDFSENISQFDEETSVEIKKKSKKDENRKVNQRHFPSVVDDQFFKLSNMSEFLKSEEIKADNEKENTDSEEINYFEDMPSDSFDESEESDDEDSEKKSSKDLMYDDFFDPPESGEGNIESGEEASYEQSEQSDVEAYDDEIASDMLDTSELKQENDVSLKSKTPFEIEQDKIKKTISDFEEKMIKKPEWHLTGEVTASNRPKDSLLHQDTDFDSSAKPVLIEDEDLLMKTEKAIISIIKNKAFSDGIRTVKPINDYPSLKKEIVLDQNKSKKSLAQVYEEDYLNKKYGEQEEENAKHVEIKKMMDSVLPELQALFCHIPKPAIPDIKIVSNLPAITVEEVAPTTISDVTLLAPEEIKKKTGTIKGQSERSDSDRKRERRKKKMFQRMKFKKMENNASNQNPLSGQARKLDKMNTLKKLKQNKNTKILEIGEDKIKSSKDFFSRLQDSVHSEAKSSQFKKRRVQ